MIRSASIKKITIMKILFCRPFVHTLSFLWFFYYELWNKSRISSLCNSTGFVKKSPNLRKGEKPVKLSWHFLISKISGILIKFLKDCSYLSYADFPLIWMNLTNFAKISKFQKRRINSWKYVDILVPSADILLIWRFCNYLFSMYFPTLKHSFNGRRHIGT